mmetsp:Transcript_84310/g.219419  ORF Transcript_84310/g.219419 Transcript_84310/m.219419 type:complete len:210 (-) Transcript_84310:1416-2045(-)
MHTGGRRTRPLHGALQELPHLRPPGCAVYAADQPGGAGLAAGPKCHGEQRSARLQRSGGRLAERCFFIAFEGLSAELALFVSAGDKGLGRRQVFCPRQQGGRGQCRGRRVRGMASGAVRHHQAYFRIGRHRGGLQAHPGQHGRPRCKARECHDPEIYESALEGELHRERGQLGPGLEVWRPQRACPHEGHAARGCAGREEPRAGESDHL